MRLNSSEAIQYFREVARSNTGSAPHPDLSVLVETTNAHREPSVTAVMIEYRVKKLE